MAKFHGAIGFAHTVEAPAGAAREVITEKSYFGDELQGSRQLREGENVNPDITTSTSLSVVLDSYISENIFAIRYAVWKGKPWVVVNATPEGRRLILTLGGVYRGRRPTPSSP